MGIVVGGRLMALGTPAELAAGQQAAVVSFRLPAQVTVSDLPPLDGVPAADGLERELTTAQPTAALHRLLGFSFALALVWLVIGAAAGSDVLDEATGLRVMQFATPSAVAMGVLFASLPAGAVGLAEAGERDLVTEPGSGCLLRACLAGGAGSGGGFEGDVVAEGFEFADVGAFAAFGADARVVIVGAEVVEVGLLVAEEVRLARLCLRHCRNVPGSMAAPRFTPAPGCAPASSGSA